MENMSNKVKIPSSFPMIYIDNVLAHYNKNKKLIFIKEQEFILSENNYEISFIIKDQMISHYFHFIEILISLYCVWKEFFHDKIIKNIIFEYEFWNNTNQNGLQKVIISKLFNKSNIIEANNVENMEISNCIVLDRSMSSSSINKFCEFCLRFAWKFAPEMRNEILSSFNLECYQKEKSFRIVYVKRDPPRRLVPELEEQLFQALAEFGGVESIDFAGKTIQEQMAISMNADIMIGVHGNGLTNAMWLPSHGTLIELFPTGVHHYDYQLMCEIFGLRYFGLEGDLIYRESSRFGPPYGHDPHHNVPVEILNITAIKNIVERILFSD